LKVRFTLHAEDKLSRLTELGITKEKIVEAVKKPEKTYKGYQGREIAQVTLTSSLVMRVVFERLEEEIY